MLRKNHILLNKTEKLYSISLTIVSLKLYYSTGVTEFRVIAYNNLSVFISFDKT